MAGNGICCPKPLVEQQIAASHAALAHDLLRLQARSLPAAGASRPTVLQISPILSPASSGACPHPLPRSSGSPSLLQVTAPAQGSQSQFRGHSPTLRFTVPAHAAACSIREGFFFPMHKWLDASWGCWQVSCGSRDGSTTAAPHSSSAEDTPRRGAVGLTDSAVMTDFIKLVAGESKETRAELGHQMS